MNKRRCKLISVFTMIPFTIVELNGFRDEHSRFIVKELSINSPSSIEFYIFKPPHQCQDIVTNTWLTKNFHGLNYNEGNVEYNQLRKILQQATALSLLVYAKGSEKCSFISSLIDKPVFDFNHFPCTKKIKHLVKMYPSDTTCGNHIIGTENSCSNVKLCALIRWFGENISLVNLMDALPRLNTFREKNQTDLMMALRGFIYYKNKILCIYCKKFIKFDFNKHMCF